MEISRLRVGDEHFLVSSMIERCPKAMMLRELVKNALEAAVNDQSGDKRVIIRPLATPEGRKLVIWNTGPGMNAEELVRICDIASSIGKQNALDQNFGMGAKVASLPSNQLGLRYRSCKDGRVHEVVMGKRFGEYGRLLRPAPSGALSEVLDVTDLAGAEGQPLHHDWTEVTLLGNRAEQDTVANPYDGAPAMGVNWIASELYARFFSLPEGVDLVLQAGCTDKPGDQSFIPLAARLPLFARHEAVPTERGIVLHYVYDAPDPDNNRQTLGGRGALSEHQSTALLIYRDEIYDRRAGGQWTHESPVFGIPFGSRYFSVLVHLPDDFPLLPDGYRQFLRHAGNLQRQINTRDYGNIALRHRPAWLLALLGQFAPDARHTEAVRNGISSLFASLRVRRRWWPPPEPVDTAARKNEPATTKKDDRAKVEKDEPAKADEQAKANESKAKPAEHRDADDDIEYEVPPQIVPLRDITDIRERGMEGKAARFYSETHQLFLNTDYSAFAALRDMLLREFTDGDDSGPVRERALVAAEQAVTERIARKLVYGLAKRDTWQRWEVDQATSMYSLSLAADDYIDSLDEARRSMRGALSRVDAQTEPAGD